METLICAVGDPEEARTIESLLAGEYRVELCADFREAAAAIASRSAAAILLEESSDRRCRLVRRAAAAGISVIEVKNLDADELRRSLHAALAERERRSEGPFTGSSPAIRRTSELIRRFAESDYPVLIIGESGTGKELAARAIHGLSRRRDFPFVARNCAAQPEQLAESEFFGTERGAFTDAVSRPGAFELARGGSLFLDEIGETKPPLQAKLLRVIESRELWRLGGQKPIPIDMRIISATCRDLREALSAGEFRSDLLFRIDTLVLEIPPLRERREDIGQLATQFALEATGGRATVGPSALRKLEGHGWPGNVRELRNVVQRALVLSGVVDEIRAEHVVFYEFAAGPSGIPRSGISPATDEPPESPSGRDRAARAAVF
jgi:transcriptional regulator with PAS, ATPase and Fis domain